MCAGTAVQPYQPWGCELAPLQPFQCLRVGMGRLFLPYSSGWWLSSDPKHTERLEEGEGSPGEEGGIADGGRLGDGDSKAM